MNRPHYVMDWTALDEAIDHCDRYYGHNALAHWTETKTTYGTETNARPDLISSSIVEQRTHTEGSIY